MATCKFCGHQCKSEQGVRAHLKRCEAYLKSKKLSALGKVPEAASTPSVEPNPSAGPDCVAPLRAFEKAMRDLTTKQEAPQTPQQLRRSILQAVKAQVVDRYQSSSGIVTATMRGDAKMAIEQQLASLPLEELPFDEVCELRPQSAIGSMLLHSKEKRREPSNNRPNRSHGAASKLKKQRQGTERLAGNHPH